jgi:Ca2+-transporting ATPase
VLQGLRTPNRVVWIVAGAAVGMLLASVYQPVLATLFRFMPLAPSELGIALLIGVASIGWFEVFKLLRMGQRKPAMSN